MNAPLGSNTSAPSLSSLAHQTPEQRIPVWLQLLIISACLSPLIAEVGMTTNHWLQSLGTRVFILHCLNVLSLVIVALFALLLSLTHFTLNKQFTIPLIALAFCASAMIEGGTGVMVAFFAGYEAMGLRELSELLLLQMSFTAFCILSAGVIALRPPQDNAHPYRIFSLFFAMLLLLGIIVLLAPDNNIGQQDLPLYGISITGICFCVIGLLIFNKVFTLSPYRAIRATQWSFVCLAMAIFYLVLYSKTDYDHYFFASLGLQLTSFALPVIGLLIDFRYWFVQDINNLQRLSTLGNSLIESEERQRTINEQLPIGLLVVNQQGLITSANHSAHRIFRYNKGALLGKKVEDLVPAASREQHQDHRADYLKDPKPRKMVAKSSVLEGQRADGTQIALEIGLAPITLEGQMHTLVTLEDVSDNIRLLEKLEQNNHRMNLAIKNLTQSNEQLERFAYVCSHDLQEPVRMVQSFSQLLAKRADDRLDEKSREYLTFITDGADRARTMITDVLQYCRLDQPSQPMELISLENVCRQVYDSLRICIQERNAHFQWDENLPYIRAVPSMLFQLLLNLVNNGIKFNRSEHPTVKISAEQNEGAWHIKVTDNGIGIDPKYQQQIFNIFERLNAKSEFSGTGIGLATCLKIAKQHDARIEVSSIENEGATFTLIWPLDQDKS